MLAKKRFGQNFLIDMSIIDHLIRVIHPVTHQHFIEIGPGLGALTKPLLPFVKQLDVIEIDRDLIPALTVLNKKHAHLIVHEADALSFDFNSLVQGRKIRVVGNLPYNISTPLLFHLLKYAENIEDMHFMLQKEVADRICALPGNKSYGRLSVMLQYYCEATFVFNVPPEAFQPKPKVHSAIIRLTPYVKKPVQANDEVLLQKIVAQAFHMRRKTIKNNLKTILNDQAWEKLEINPQKRPEALTVEEFVRITNFM